MPGDLVIPPGFGQMTWKWEVQGRVNPISTTMGFTKNGDDVTLGDLVDNAFLQLTGTGAPCNHSGMDTIFTFTEISCVYNNDGVMEGAVSSVDAVVGTVSSADPMIIGNSLIVRKRTGRIGRQFRGRMYFPLMYGGEGNVDYLGNIDPSIVPVLQAKFDDWWELVTGDETKWIPNILHHPPLEGITPDPTPITSVLVESSVGTQRRRLR